MAAADAHAEQAASLFKETTAQVVLNDLSMSDFYTNVGRIKSIVRQAFADGKAAGYNMGWNAHVAMVDERVRDLAMTAEQFRDIPVPDCEPW